MIFHLLFVAAFVTLLALRIHYHRQARTWERTGLTPEGPLVQAARWLLGLPMLAITIAYLFRPSRLDFARVSLPDPARWLGAGLVIAALPCAYLIHRELGRNFSGELRIRQDHQLITSGPYRYVRHPMYTVFTVNMIGFVLLTANWLLFLPAVLALLVVMIVRTPKEEAMLLQAFGDDYRAYMQRTGRYLPRLLRR